MAPLRFICFVFVLVLVHLRDSTAQTRQDMKKTVLEAARRSSTSTHVEKDAGLAVLGGRKRRLKKVLKKEEALNREDSISGLRNGSSRAHDHEKFKMGGFTALSADYHVPQSHPPRNN